MDRTSLDGRLQVRPVAPFVVHTVPGTKKPMTLKRTLSVLLASLALRCVSSTDLAPLAVMNLGSRVGS